MDNTISPKDRNRLRELAQKRLELAGSDTNVERREQWCKYGRCENDRPLLLVETQAVIDDFIRDQDFQCEGEFARSLESQFLWSLCNYDFIKDDHVIEPTWNVGWHVSWGDCGVETIMHSAESFEGFGAKTWEHPIKNLDDDLDKLKFRQPSVDRSSTAQHKEAIEGAFGDILDVRYRMHQEWSYGMTNEVIKLIGLENFMLYMYDNPDGLHRLMAFMRDDRLKQLDWLEQEGLVTLNNEEDYTGSGSLGYSHDLPATEEGKNGNPGISDLWGLLA